ncbi:MAG: hypothetical protein NVS2B8_05150 [Vulcanimicrobiaceae bacterium]
MKDPRINVAIGGVLHTGRELHVLESVALDEFASYRFDQPLDVNLRIRRAGRGLDLQGTITGEAQGVCARCLDDVRLPLALAIEERFDPPSENDHPLGESNVLVGDDLDLQDLVRQLVDSALPIVLLCNDDCIGLCTTCGFKAEPTCRCTPPE